MQTMRHKILLTFCFYFVSKLLFASISEPQQALRQADSLFMKKKYTEAIFFYDSLFNQEKVYTPQMLRKLAFVEEGLGNYQKTLYYLNYLYFWHPETDVANKMTDLSEKHDLSGYQASDLDLVYKLYTDYRLIAIYVLIGFIVTLMAFVVYGKLKENTINHVGIVFSTLFLAGLFYLINFNPFPKKAIIAKANTLLMNDASSASNLIDAAKEGNRVKILGEKDNWYLIEYNDTTAFVKKGQLDVVE